MKIADAVWVWDGRAWERGNIINMSSDLVTVMWADGQQNSLQFMDVHISDPRGSRPCNRCGKLDAQYQFGDSILCGQCFGQHTN